MSGMRIRELDHIVLNVADVDRSLDFYTGFLGLKEERLEQYRRGEVKFPSVRITADTIVDLFPPPMHEAQRGSDPNLNHICLVVEGRLHVVQEALAEAGIAVENGPVEVFGARGNGTSVYVRDPDGNVVELRSYEGI